MLYYYIDKNFYKIKNINTNLNLVIINYFYKLVNNDKD